MKDRKEEKVVEKIIVSVRRDLQVIDIVSIFLEKDIASFHSTFENSHIKVTCKNQELDTDRDIYLLILLSANRNRT